MIIELGHFAAISTLVLLAFQVLSGLYAASSQSPIYLAFSHRCLKLGALLLLLSYSTLCYGFLCDEFSLSLVAAYSSVSLPWMYKCAALWSSHSGGIMLWVLCIYAVIYRIVINRTHFSLALVAYMQVISGFFALTLLGYLLFYLNPFERTLPAFPDVGRDLMPILQNRAILLHAPLIYGAYAVLSVPYFYVAAQLLHGRVDWRGLLWLKSWLYGGWILLTLALALSISFASLLPGWGLWWDWDPVENMLLLLWLLDSALLHAVCYSTRHRRFLSLVVMFSLIIFLLCLTVSFLIHSNMITSAHHFSPDGPSALPFLVVLTINGIMSIVLYTVRKYIFPVSDPWISYSSAHIMLHGIMVSVVMAFVLVLGLLYPIWVGVMHKTTLWIGPPYYNQMFAIFMVPMVGLMVWHIILENMDMRRSWLLVYTVLTLTVFAVMGFFWSGTLSWAYGFLSIMLASGFAFVLAIGRRVHQAGWYYLLDHGAMISAHLGVWFLIIGAFCSISLTQSGEVMLPIGESVAIGKVNLAAERSYHKRGDNYVRHVLDIQVAPQSGSNGYVHPEMRTYDVTKDTQPIVITKHIGVDVLRLILSQHHQDGGTILWYWIPYAFLGYLGGGLLLLGICWAGFIAWYKRFHFRREKPCAL